MKNFICLASISIGFSAFAQLNAKNVNSGEELQKAFKAYENEEYLESIEFYRNIPKNDTNYATSIYEIGLSYYRNEDYDKALEVLDQAKEYKEELGSRLYSLIGTIYDDKENPDKAIEVYSEALETFDKDYNLYFNRGITYYNQDKFDLAKEDFQMALHYNFEHIKSHYMLGRLAARNNQHAQAILSLSTALYYSPNSAFTGDIAKLLLNISTGSEKGEANDKDFSKDQEMFASTNLLIENKVALDKKYKVKLSVPLAIGKQLHLIAESTELDESNEGFWAKHYLPMYQKIVADGRLDNLHCYMLSGIDSDEIQKKIKKKIKSDDKQYLYNQWIAFSRKQYMPYKGKVQDVYAVYGKSGISATGFVEDNTVKDAWEYYNDKNLISAEGNWNDDGEKEGLWTYYYEDGSLKEKTTFKNSEPNGVTTVFYKGLNLASKKITFKDGKREDTTFYLYKSGDVKEFEIYKDNEREGKNIAYYENGNIHYDANYKAGEIDGNIKVYYPNGELEKEIPFKEGNRNGPYKEFHPNGKLHIETTYKEGKYDGNYKSYFIDGTLAEERSYAEGQIVGTNKIYYPDGTLYQTQEFDENGKENGLLVEFTEEGVKLSEIEIKKGELVAYTYFNADGSIFKEGKKRGKEFDYKTYDRNQVLRSEGKLVNGEYDGEWKFYNEYGILREIEKYKNGKIHGEIKEYYSNGKVKEKYTYKDGLLNGLYTVFNLDGTIDFEGIYENGNASGSFYNYYKNGNVASIRFYTGNKKHGVQEYFAPNNVLELTEDYDFGEFQYLTEYDTSGNSMGNEVTKHNLMEFYDPSKSYVRYKKQYKNNKVNGDAVTYYPNGDIAFKGNYINGKAEGTFVNYHINGKVSNERSYVNDELQGEYKNYFEDGTLKTFYNYLNGKKEGECVTYFENGKKDFSGTYKLGEKHGKCYNHNLNGEVVLIRHYRYGVLLGYSYLGTDKKEVAMIPLKNGTGEIKTYHPNGKVALEQKRVGGEIEGKSTSYFSNGKVYEEENFISTYYHGKRLTYYSSGKKRSEAEYLLGDLNGIYVKYHANGKVKTEGKYICDEAFGDRKVYNSKGELLRTTTYYNDEIIKNEVR